MGVTVDQWWAAKMPVTRGVIAATVIISLSRLLPPKALSPTALWAPFIPSLVLNALVWPIEILIAHLLTQLFDAGSLGLGFLLNVLVVAHFSQLVEVDVFYGLSNDVMYFPRRELFTENNAPSDGRSSPIVSSLRYLWFLLVYGVLLVLTNILVVRTHGCLPMLLSYVWCRLQPASTKLGLPFVSTKVSVRSYPIILCGIHFLMGQSLVPDIVAILLGQIFCYTFHVRRHERADLGRLLFDVPLFVYRAVKRSYLWRFDQLRQQGRLF